MFSLKSIHKSRRRPNNMCNSKINTRHSLHRLNTYRTHVSQNSFLMQGLLICVADDLTIALKNHVFTLMTWTNGVIDFLIINCVLGYDLILHVFNELHINARDQCLWPLTSKTTAFELEHSDSESPNTSKSCLVNYITKKVLWTIRFLFKEDYHYNI